MMKRFSSCEISRKNDFHWQNVSFSQWIRIRSGILYAGERGVVRGAVRPEAPHQTLWWSWRWGREKESFRATYKRGKGSDAPSPAGPYDAACHPLQLRRKALQT